MVRVLHVYRTYYPDTQGGGQEVIRQITKNCKSLGIESRIFSPSANPSKLPVEVDGVKVIQVKLEFEIASCGFCLFGLSEFNRQVEWADIIHYHFPWPFGDVLHFLGRVSKPSLITYHSDIVRQQGLLGVYRPLMDSFLSSVSRIIATSPNYVESSEVLQKKLDKTYVVPIGIDEFEADDTYDCTLEKMHEAVGDDFFFFVGVLRYYKCLHILILAAENQDFRVVIAGGGPLESELKKLANSRGITNVEFIGRITDAEKFACFDLCKGVVFPSYERSEAFGVTLLEGSMRSKPLITTDIGSGTSYVNIHMETGIVVEPDDAYSLREALLLLEKDEALVSLLGTGARARYEQHFTSELMAEGYSSHYKDLLELGK